MPRVFFAIFLSLAASAGSAAAADPVPASAPTPTIQQAASTYFQMQVPQAEAMFRAIADDPKAPARDRAGAGRGLARIQWMIDRQGDAALATLDKAFATGADLCPTAALEVRFLAEMDQPARGAKRAAELASACPGAAQGDLYAIVRAKDELAWAASASDAADRRAALDHASATLGGLSKLGVLAPAAARLKLELALQTSDAAGALDAWRGFFWLTDHNAPASFGLSDDAVVHTFNAALGAQPSVADEIALERLLIRAGFYDAAKRFDATRTLSSRAGNDPAYKPVAAYFSFRKRFDDATLAFNRAYARGHGDERAYAAEVKKIFADTAAQVGGGDPEKTLHDAFGLHWMEGQTGGVESVHMGHVVEDAPYHVVQYGRQGQVHFISIDNMASNGYQSWLWDGMASTGGWSENENDIVQIRASYTGGPLQSLATYDPTVAKKRAQDLADAEARDREALKKPGAVFLPALQTRLQDEARDQMAAAAKAEAAKTGQPFERIFLRMYWDAEVGHSIYIHEGRHALDHQEFKGLRTLAGAELEYRAKLSEIELATYPRMPLDNILSADIGDNTAHGIADARIMTGLTDWIVAHKSEVAGYDPNVPAAEQIDKLSDDQMRAIAKTMDPYFTEHPDQR
jgi:hypothetical protein